MVHLFSNAVQRGSIRSAVNRVAVLRGLGFLAELEYGEVVLAGGGSMIVGFYAPKPDEVRPMNRERKEDPLLLTPTQCAARLKISRSHLYNILDTPDGPRSITIGRCRRIRESELQRWLDELSD